MNDRTKDVIVIGNGMAGTTAAKAAADAKASVEIITKGAGATLMGSGTLDVLGAVPKAEGNQMVSDIQEGIRQLLEVNPNHPYGVLRHSLENGVKAFCEVCRAGGLEYIGDGVKNAVLPNILGTFKSTAYIPSYNRCADISRANGKILVAGFKGHTEFYPEYACKSYHFCQKKFAPEADAIYLATTLELPSLAQRTKVTNAELASFFDTAEGIHELADALKDIRNMLGGIQRILLPPVLGYRNYAKNRRQLRDMIGVSLGEIAEAGHSISAQRLAAAYEKGLHELGIGLTSQAKAVSITKRADGEFCVTYEKQGKTKEAYAREVVLATGGCIGGGITSYREDLYVPVLGEPLGRIEAGKVDQRVFPQGGQPFTKIGVKVYDNMALAQGKLSGQIFACGDLMDGYDWIYERSGGGIAVSSGYLAGKNAAERAIRRYQADAAAGPKVEKPENEVSMPKGGER